MPKFVVVDDGWTEEKTDASPKIFLLSLPCLHSSGESKVNGKTARERERERERESRILFKFHLGESIGKEW